MSFASYARGTHSFGWLWLTDLHFGQSGQSWLWPIYREDFFEDLIRLHRKCGPWDAVVFTGDLVYSGLPAEFNGLTPVLKRIWETLASLQDKPPVFLSVPGNHDLKRPEKSAATTVAMRHWWDDADVQDEFWNKPDSDYRRTVSTSLTPYSDWCCGNGLPPPVDYQAGLLPGEFSSTITKNGAKLGFVGLNTTFLQISDEDYQGKLDLHPRQLSDACGGDHAGWIQDKHASILLTHQPPDWLHRTSHERYLGAIYPPRSFAAHFYGHMHESASLVSSSGMGPERRQIQGCSLYGLERFGEAFDKERFKFGYAAVRLEMDGGQGRLFLWPRAAVLKNSKEWRLGPDQGYELVDGEEYTRGAEFPLHLVLLIGHRLPAAPTPSSPAGHDSSQDASTVSFILQYAQAGLPEEVVTAALRLSPERVERLIGIHLDCAPFQERRECRLLADFQASLLRPDADDLLARTLTELLGFIGQHKSDGLGLRYVESALSLARRCKDVRPRAVCVLFNTLDRMLKRRGDKHKVFEAASLSIDATRHQRRTPEEVEIEAKALICGRSWVLQRMERLAEALTDAERSLQLGEQIGWERNTAFCKKCVGRIYRMMAMREPDASKKADLFAKSVESLKGAIRVFGGMKDFGPDSAEVGDCYSLLARTYLVAGQLRDARACLNKASDRLKDENDKDFLDYSILEGDYSVAISDHETAEGYYRFVIDANQAGDFEKSEIRARAFFHRGLSRASRILKGGASSDFEKAAEIWDGLDERAHAAEARWHLTILQGVLSPKSAKALEKESFTSRMIAVEIHKSRLAALSSNNPRRSEPDRTYWQQIILEARKQDALKEVTW